MYRLSGFSKNLRKEISKQDKILFYDLGIRNSIIKNISNLSNRNDQGLLWENFLISERLKKRRYASHYTIFYFWRTYTGAELDLVEEYDGKLFGFEFKWSSKIPKAPKNWMETYENAHFEAVNIDNYLSFIL